MAFEKLKFIWRDPAIRFGAAVVFLVWSSVAQQITRQSQDTRDQAWRDTGNFARAMEEGVLRSVKQIEFNLEFLRSLAARTPQSHWGALIKDLPVDPETTLQVAITDTRGMMIASSLDIAPSRPVDLSDREHVRIHLQGGGVNKLYVSTPLIGRVSKKATIQFSRPIIDAEGKLAGVVVVSLDPQHIARFYERLELGAHSAIAVVGDDGIVRAGAGAALNALGQKLPPGAAALQGGSGNEGTHRGKLWDDREKYTVWRRVPDAPLVVGVSADAAMVASENDGLRTFLLLAAVLATIAVGVASWMLSRERRRLQFTQARLAVSERRAREQSKRLKITLGNMNQGIVMVDAGGAIVVRSDMAVRLLGLERHPDRAAVDEALRGLIARSANQDASSESAAAAPDARPGEGISLSQMTVGDKVVKIVTVPLGDGGCVATFEDVTEWQRRHDDLVDAKAAADNANRAKSAFLASMSHEIRTPMNGVIGMTEVLLDTPLNAEQARYAESIAASAASLLVIINDMLDFSKIEAGKMTLDRRSFDLRAMLEEVVMPASVMAAEKGIEIVLHYDRSLPGRWRGDPVRIRQIVTNLVGNAVKFTQSGHVVLSVASTGRDNVGTHRLAISVRDTGVGIAKERLGQVFEEFVQLGTPSRHKHGGTGLGLAISQRLAHLMDGHIDVSSKPGAGSTFTFALPLPQAEAAAEELPAVAAGVAGKRALIVEALSDAAEALADCLHAEQIAVERVAGLDALRDKLAGGARYDVVFVGSGIYGEGKPELSDEIAALLAAPEARELRSRLVLMPEVGRPMPLAGNGAEVTLPTLRKPFRAGDLRQILHRLAGVDAGKPAVSAAKVLDVSALTARPCTRLKVLAAEDGPTNRLVLASMLKSEPIDLVFAHDGAEAVRAFAKERPDLVLMDMWMPELDGFQATAKIRALETEGGHEPTPIVAVTANAVRGDREKCIAAGMDDYMSKPIVKKDLLRMIARWNRYAGGNARPHRSDPRVERRTRDGDGSLGGRWPTEPPLIDAQQAAGIAAELGEAGFAEAVTQFGRDVENSLYELCVAVRAGSPDEIRQLLLLIRGCASSLGISGLMRLCDRIRCDIEAGCVEWPLALVDLTEVCTAANVQLPKVTARLAS
jgi:signal transduction histidine kinase/CheY-like chemotaxis protein